jgi:signal transduction histidine kinase
MIIGGGILNATRPSNFIVTCIITIVSVFILYFVVPFKFRYQVLLASFATIGETLIIFWPSNNQSPPVVYSLIFSMFVANLIAAFGAWKLHTYRKRIFQEFMQRKALQEELEKHANQLSELVTERTHDLVEAQSRLVQSERLAAIGEMAGMVGHDLRNPLAAIKNANYYLKKKPGSNENNIEMLTIIDKAVDHANSIVADLLDFSREIHLELEEYSPKSLINYVCFRLKFQAILK